MNHTQSLVASDFFNSLLRRQLTVNDKKLVARKLATLSPAALKTAEIEVASAVVLHVGSLACDAVERAERYAADRDAFIEMSRVCRVAVQ